jgi:hypothetical protein
MDDDYKAAVDRAREAWKRLDEFWQSGTQGTPEGYEALRELNEALTDVANAMPGQERSS